uniref:hypothetical protein n=1 Tax=Vaginimicrobium propionicum TaxID=1871034 RepID=UPI000970BEFE|nr:hypothetical protein [Vaginimicrobium propionicum]
MAIEYSPAHCLSELLFLANQYGLTISKASIENAESLIGADEDISEADSYFVDKYKRQHRILAKA